MERKLFKPKDITEAKHAAVGDCNGMSMEDRWRLETPLFAKSILKYAGKGDFILDYGCGPGRILKELSNQNSNVLLFGTDASSEMMSQAREYAGGELCHISPLKDLYKYRFDVIYCVYVLQHVPAIEIREVLSNIYNLLKPEGKFIYCSSDYRMAMRFDGQGFFDDRFLGVNLQDEIGRFFNYESELFNEKDYSEHQVLRTMVLGENNGLPHPAKVYNKKKEGNVFIVEEPEKEHNTTTTTGESFVDIHTTNCMEADKLLLINRLAPGDILVMSSAIRDLHKAHPGRYITDIRTPCNELYDNSPYIQKLQYDETEYQRINSEFSKRQVGENPIVMMGDIRVIDMHYPLIHRSGATGAHFSQGHTEYLSEVLGVKIPITDIRPDLFLSQAEKDWVSPVAAKRGFTEPYWALNAGSKDDYTLKQYPYYQEVVNILKDRIYFVQIGVKSHKHIPIDFTVDMVGETGNIRDLIRLINHSLGVITCVSLPMHIAAALNKPCVVVAGAREGTRWELYPNHQFIYVNGCVPCARYDGCWRSKLGDCDYKEDGVPICMKIISPGDVARAVERYYDGGMILADEYTLGGVYESK